MASGLKGNSLKLEKGAATAEATASEDGTGITVTSGKMSENDLWVRMSDYGAYLQVVHASDKGFVRLE